MCFENIFLHPPTINRLKLLTRFIFTFPFMYFEISRLRLSPYLCIASPASLPCCLLTFNENLNYSNFLSVKSCYHIHLLWLDKSNIIYCYCYLWIKWTRYRMWGAFGSVFSTEWDLIASGWRYPFRHWFVYRFMP